MDISFKKGCLGATVGSCMAGGVTFPLLGAVSVVAMVGGVMFLKLSRQVHISDAKLADWGRWTAFSGIAAGAIGIFSLASMGTCCACGTFAGATNCYDI